MVKRTVKTKKSESTLPPEKKLVLPGDAFCKDYFLPYQKNWVLDDSTLKLYEKSRRIGITYATSYRCFNKCLRQPENSKFKQWVSSRDEKTAMEFVTDYVAMWASGANAVSRGLYGEYAEVVDAEKGIKALVVKFKNGSKIYSLSSNPKAFAGKGGDILLDEFDLHENQDVLYDMAVPCLTWGGQLEIVSAYDPQGSEYTVFANFVKEIKNLGNPMGFSLHSTTLEQAVEQGFVETVNKVKARKGIKPQTRKEFFASMRKRCRTIDAFNSQYMCIPNSASGQQAIRSIDLTAAKKVYEILRIDVQGNAAIGDEIDPSCEPYTDPMFWRQALYNKKVDKFAVGYDVARKTNLAAIWIDAVIQDNYRLAALMTFRNCKFESQKQVMFAIMDAFYNVVGAGDETGMGGPTCEALQTRYPDRFKPVNFASLKTELGTLMMEVFEQGRQEIPMTPAEIGADIAGIRKDTSQNNKRIFTERPNELNEDSHCDMAWACGLAKFAGEKIDDPGPAKMESAGSGNSGGDWDLEYEKNLAFDGRPA